MKRHIEMEKHMEECAIESGVDLESEVRSDIKQGPIESWLQDDAMVFPWRAFIPGKGTGWGWTREEAIADIMAK